MDIQGNTINNDEDTEEEISSINNENEDDISSINNENEEEISSINNDSFDDNNKNSSTDDDFIKC
jgi:hypothetical protein